ncbi:S-adenosyl-L-methionine-dependent methyltransferase [Xylaria palmicola]|nr:S-adenosyl-L-methionine-dependent methyltransferase [Xylaria palmicola]
MSPETQTTPEAKEIGFSTRHGVDWAEYTLFRPSYRESFFKRIYDYHADKNGVCWSTAHDVGAGNGVVSSALADRFHRVVVSDPNEGYNEVARHLLLSQHGDVESNFVFLQESAEKSSVETGSVDLITVCECMHYMDTDAAVSEFARQLKPGGTLAITYYSLPLIVGNEHAHLVWREIMGAFKRRTTGPMFDRAFEICSSAYDSIALPPAHWHAVKRVYVNASRGRASFSHNDDVGEDRVESSEERIWVYGDPDWSDEQGVDWLKGSLATWAPRIPESEIQDLWDELADILDGAKVRIETPMVTILATRRAENSTVQ